MYHLPLELHIEISHLLPLQSISSLAKTCNQFNNLYSALRFWERLFNKEYSIFGPMVPPKMAKLKLSKYPDSARYYDQKAQSIYISVSNSPSNFVTPPALPIPSHIDPKKFYQSSELWILKSNNGNFTFKKKSQIRVKQISSKYRIGCLIDMNDHLWCYTERCNKDNRELCEWDNTQRYAKSAVAGSFFILFIGLDDYVYYYFPQNKRFVPLIDKEHIQAHTITFSRESDEMFAVATCNNQVLLYHISNPLPGYVCNMSVRTIHFNLSHLIFVDIYYQVWIFRVSDLGAQKNREIYPTLIKQGTVHVTAKSVSTNCDSLNAIIIGLDHVVRKLIISGDQIIVQEMSSIARLNKFIHPCQLVEKVPNKLVLRHDPSIPLAKSNNSYLCGWKELKALTICIGYDFCWLTDLNGHLWCFSKNMAGGTKFPDPNFRIKQVSGNLLMRQR